VIDLAQIHVTYASAIDDTLRLALAYSLALPIGFNREHEQHTAGVRTFPIVAMASCGLAMIGRSVPGASPESYSRILQGLVAGLGFIGGGAILKDKVGGVSGTATAASVWNVGIVGAAVGLGVYHVAVMLALANLLTLKVLVRFKPPLQPPPVEPM
jgi:putative Mg2+ transporter-C (MgtC) family protein